MKYLLKYTAILTVIISLFTSCQKDPADIINSYLKPPLADAGTPRTVTLPASFDTLHGTSTSYNGTIHGYLWSLISGPSVPNIESPSSPATRVSNMIAGKYKFQFAVIDSAGLTGVDTTSITVLPDPRPIQTLTLQPNNNINEATLSWTNSGNQTGANFILPELVSGAWTDGGELFLLRGIIKFDLSSIPINANILSAKLTLFSNPTPLNGNHIDANYGNSNAMYIERVTNSWNSTLTWANQPSGHISSQILISQTNFTMLDLVDVDVRTLVAPMISTNNYGFKIRLQNEVIYNIRNFCSSKYADATKHPKLVITYQ